MEFGLVNNWGFYRQFSEYIAPGICLLCESLISHAQGSLLCQDCKEDGPNPLPMCQRCGCLLPASGTFCVCLEGSHSLDRIIAVRHYHYPVNRLVQEMKYHGRLGLCREFGLAISKLVHSTNSTLPNCLIPVPMHRSRLRERGYNQALEIANVVSERLGMPLETNLITRSRPTVPQIDLNPEARTRNVRGAFVVHKQINYDHVAIIDDVFTTGATAFELAKLLRSSGVRKVELWSYAIASR